MPSSRTPDGFPIECPTCGVKSQVLRSQPPGDTVCPSCGAHLWIDSVSSRGKAMRHQLFRRWRSKSHWPAEGAERTDSEFGRALSLQELRDSLQHLRYPSLLGRLMLWWTNQSDLQSDPWAARACGIIDAMTAEEKVSPETIDGSRVRRIAAGSGTSNRLVREVLQIYTHLQENASTQTQSSPSGA